MQTLSKSFNVVQLRKSVFPSLLPQLFCLIAVLYLLNIPPVIWAQQENTPGIPANMGTGVTETVNEIMSREAQPEAGRSGKPFRIVPIGRVDRQHLKQHPNAPDVPRWPYAGGVGVSNRQPSPDVVSPGAGPLAPQSLGVNVVVASSA